MVTIIMAVVIICSVLYHLSIYKLGIRRGHTKVWAAWLPVGDQIMLAKLSDEYRLKKTTKNVIPRIPMIIAESIFIVCNYLAVIWGLFLFGVMLLIGLGSLFSIVFLALTGRTSLLEMISSTDIEAYFQPLTIIVPVLLISTVVRTVFHGMTLYDVLRSCRPEKSTLFLILSLVFPPVKPFLLFHCRNYDGSILQGQSTSTEDEEIL